MTNVSTEQKVDYIYKELKTKKMVGRFKFLFKSIILFGILFFIFVYLPSYEKKDEIIENFTSKIIETVKPVVTDIVSDINIDLTSKIETQLSEITSTGSTATGSTVKISNIKLPKDILLRLKNNPDILDELLKR